MSDARFELVYGTGGHGGPYLGYPSAIRAAVGRLKGCPTEHVIYIVHYSAPQLISKYAIGKVKRNAEGGFEHINMRGDRA